MGPLGCSAAQNHLRPAAVRARLGDLPRRQPGTQRGVESRKQQYAEPGYVLVRLGSRYHLCACGQRNTRATSPLARCAMSPPFLALVFCSSCLPVDLAQRLSAPLPTFHCLSCTPLVLKHCPHHHTKARVFIAWTPQGCACVATSEVRCAALTVELTRHPASTRSPPFYLAAPTTPPTPISTTNPAGERRTYGIHLVQAALLYEHAVWVRLSLGRCGVLVLSCAVSCGERATCLAGSLCCSACPPLSFCRNVNKLKLSRIRRTRHTPAHGHACLWPCPCRYPAANDPTAHNSTNRWAHACASMLCGCLPC